MEDKCDGKYDHDDERVKNIGRFKYMQDVVYKNNMLCIYMNDENINIVDNLSLCEIYELNNTLDKYSNAGIDVLTKELSNDISDLSKYFAKFNIYDETRRHLMYHYYDNCIII